MLQFIRDKSQGWLAWTIVIAICCVFALWGVHSYLYGSAAQSVVAKVNRVKITRQQLDVVYNQMRRQQQLQLGANYSPSAQTSSLLKKMALQSIISSIVLNKAAKSDGFRVAPELVETLLAKMPIFQVNGVFSQALFEQFVNNLSFSTDSYLAQLKNSILLDQIKSGIMNTAFVLPQEVERTIQLINQKRSFNYVIIPINRFFSNIKITRDMIESYYHNNLDDFKLSEKVSIQYLQLSITDLMRKINPTSAQLKDFYTNNLVSYTKPKRWRLAGILIATPSHATKKQIKQAQQKLNLVTTKMKQHVNFATLAKQYSDDLRTAKKGGEWPWMTEAQLPADLKAALLSLKKSGDVSMPIKITQGYFILKLLQIKPQQVVPYNAVKNKVLQIYKQQRAEQRFADLRDQLANITYEHPESLQQAAKQLSLSIHTTSLFTKDGGKQGITKNPRVIAAAFNDDVLNQHNNSDPVDLSDNMVMILRIKHHIPASVKKIAEVQSQIMNKLRKQQAAKKAEDLGNVILNDLQAGKTLNYVASKYKLNWRKVTSAGRHAKGIDTNILSVAFNIMHTAKKNAAAVTGLSLPSDNYAIVALTGIKDGNIKQLSASQRHVFQETAVRKLGLLEYQLYVAGLIKKAKIKKMQTDE